MQLHLKGERMAGERTAATVAVIKRAIQGRACLSGTHVAFRVRFAPHALGRDKSGRQSVIAFEYGGMTLGRSHWVCFAVDRLRGLEPTGDPWRTGPLESRRQFALTTIEAAVDAMSDCSMVLAHRKQERRTDLDVKKPRAILTLGGLVEPPAPTRPKLMPQQDACRDAIAALADAGLPLFERMRAEGCCLPQKIGIWREIASRTDPVSHAALKAQIAILARSRPYLAACAAEGAMRHDLDGKVVEPVTPEHRQRATRLRPRREK